MKKIAAFNIARLLTEESFGFQKLVMEEIGNLMGGVDSPEEISLLAANDTVLQEQVDTYTGAYNAFDAALKASASLPSTAIASAADDARDKSWRGGNNYADSMCDHPDAELAGIAVEVKALYDKYGDPTGLSQTAESGVLHNLLQDLTAFPAEKRAKIHFDAWLNDLKAKEDAFLDAVASRTEEESARQVGIVKETRLASEAAYRSLVETVNALARINGDAEYATFIDHMNVLIDRQKAVLKNRSTKAKNEKGNGMVDSPTEI